MIKEELIKKKAEIKELIKQSGALEYARVIMRANQLQVIDLIDSMDIGKEWKEELFHYF